MTGALFPKKNWCAGTPPVIGPFFRRKLVPYGYGRSQNETGLPNRNPTPTPVWLSAQWRDAAISRYNEKTYDAGTFFFANLLDGAYDAGKTERRPVPVVCSRCIFEVRSA